MSVNRAAVKGAFYNLAQQTFEHMKTRHTKMSIKENNIKENSTIELIYFKNEYKCNHDKLRELDLRLQDMRALKLYLNSEELNEEILRTEEMIKKGREAIEKLKLKIKIMEEEHTGMVNYFEKNSLLRENTLLDFEKAH